jgi:hypothetical protein
MCRMEPRDLLEAVLELERHANSEGWDQPTLLFALVHSADVRREQPELARQIGIAESGPAITSFEQEPPGPDQAIDEFLARIEWPNIIAGAAIVVERVVLPPEAEKALANVAHPDVEARAHPQAREMRIVAAVARSGEHMCAVRMLGAPDDSVLTGNDLVPGLAEALAATFR